MILSAALRRGARRALPALVLALLVATLAWASAGTTGTLTGVAVDASTKAPIEGAKITVTGPSAVASTVTDRSGHFTFASLPPDAYTVSLDAPGYVRASLSDVEVAADNVLVVTLSASK